MFYNQTMNLKSCIGNLNVQMPKMKKLQLYVTFLDKEKKVSPNLTTAFPSSKSELAVLQLQ